MTEAGKEDDTVQRHELRNARGMQTKKSREERLPEARRRKQPADILTLAP